MNFYKLEPLYINENVVKELNNILNGLKIELKKSYLLKELYYPKIVVADKSMLVEYKSKHYDVGYWSGWFNDKENKIYLNPLFYDDKNISYDAVRDTVLHELIHYLQKKLNYYLFNSHFLDSLIYLLNSKFEDSKSKDFLLKKLFLNDRNKIETLYFVSIFYREFEAYLINALSVSKNKREQLCYLCGYYVDLLLKKLISSLNKISFDNLINLFYRLGKFSSYFIAKKFPEFNINNLGGFLDDFYLDYVKKGRIILFEYLDEILNQFDFKEDGKELYKSIKDSLKEEMKNYLELNKIY